MLTPLRQWICDTCGQLINSPEDGWVEWLDANDHKSHGFRIVHHASASPRGSSGSGCYQYDRNPSRSDVHLEEFLGDGGLIHLMAFVDPGPHNVRDYKGPEVADLREWVELTRRLFLSYYEEARQYWVTAEGDGFFDSMNEIAVYLPETLQRLIEEYGR